MIIQYPEDLLAEIKEKMADHRLAGFTPGQGKVKPDIMLVGEAPGRHEEVYKIPFSGASGKELMKMLASIGYQRDDVYITSVVRQRPYSIKQVINKKTGEKVEKKPNRTPTQKEVLAFAKLFDWELGQIQPQIIVPLGNTALHRLLGPKSNIGRLHGKVIHEKIQMASAEGKGYQLSPGKYWLVPMYHPAAVLYSRKLEPTINDDWQELGEFIHEFKQGKVTERD